MNAWILAVSLINAVLLFWLGLTVMLNAERRTWGLWLNAGGLVGGGLFFLAQAAVAGQGLQAVAIAMHLQWPLGWLVGLALPLAWYLTMLWYTGFWEERRSALRRRHGPWLVIAGVAAAGVLFLVGKAGAVPVSWAHPDFAPFAKPAVDGVPLLVPAYPLFIFLCVALALEALRQRGPEARLGVDRARQRARPWLVATSLVMLLISVLLGAVMVGVAVRAPGYLGPTLPGRLPVLVVWGDLVVSALVTAAVLLLGQAVVAYEIFTGGTLPRRGLQRQWQGAIALAVAYGAVMAVTFAASATHLWGLLVATFVIAAFFALFNWQSFVERDRYLESLRPFVSSAHVYDAVLESRGAEIDAAGPFRALVTEVLDAQVAYLIPVGPLSALAAPALAWPEERVAPGDLGGLPAPEAGSLSLPLDPARYGGAVWGVPLWSERGLIGWLLLGEKTEGGIYGQEEIEIARATGERLIDTLACGRMAQRLMALQRERLAESQVVDRRTRRLVHDEILPALHAALLGLSGMECPGECRTHPPAPLPGREGGKEERGSERGERGSRDRERGSQDAATAVPPAARGRAAALPDREGSWKWGREGERGSGNGPEGAEEGTGKRRWEEAVRQLTEVHRRLSDLLHDMPTPTLAALGRLGLVGMLRRTVEEEFPEAFDGVSWEIGEAAAERAQGLALTTAEVVFYAAREAVRNAARHGRGDQPGRPLHLRVRLAAEPGLRLSVEDDGVGGAYGDVRGGRGMALHSTMMAVVGGEWLTESDPGEGTRVTLVVGE